MGSDRGGSRLYHLLDGRGVVRFPGLVAKPPDDDAVAVDDDTFVPSGVVGAAPGLSEQIVDTAGRYVRTGGVGHPLHWRAVAFEGQSCGFPVGDARHVVVDLIEPEALEPARGSWRHVSQPVVSVHHHGFIAAQHRHGLGGEASERETDRSRDMRLGVFPLGEDIDDLGIFLVDETQQLGAVDRSHHDVRSPASRRGVPDGAEGCQRAKASSMSLCCFSFFL